MADRVKFGPDRKRQLAGFLREEIDRVLDERGEMEDNWERWIETYRAPKPKILREFPFEGASDFTFPVTHMSVDPVKAKYMATLHATANLWTTKPLNERWVQLSKPLQDYLQWLDGNIVKMYDVNSRVLNEMLKLGTGIYKTGWKYSRSPTMGYDSDLVRQKMVRIVNQPVVDQVYNNNFLIPPEALAIDPDKQGGAHWVAERIRMRP